VNGAQEPPGLGEKLAAHGGLHLSKEGAAMHRVEVRQVPEPVELVCYGVCVRGYTKVSGKKMVRNSRTDNETETTTLGGF
jgi:hypothetical protein